ncbi:Scoloptoxin SSD14, partial [Pseudolycoriella hygida]
MRFIRRRLVLAVIFLLSLTYCLINLLGHGGPLSIESDYIEIKREQPIIWQSFPQTTNFSNDPNTICRNSVQGKVLIVDDRGFVCQRTDLQSTGCCDVDAVNSKFYSCDTCNLSGCCTIYEYCVSCCLNPDKKSLLEQVIDKAIGPQRAVFASVKDHFELCLAKCRTDSHSVQHENKYRDPKSKHCYGLTEAHESQREVIESNDLVSDKMFVSFDANVRRSIDQLRFNLNQRHKYSLLNRAHTKFELTTKKVIIFIIVIAVAVGVGVGLYFGLRNVPVHISGGAVVANGFECAEIGANILRRNGSAADAAIATLFCEGVSCPQSMGLGGGFILTIYTKSSGKVESLTARETAPSAATVDMYVNKTVTGPLAIAVPGELKGYWELHKKYGRLSWASLIDPTIELCRRGHVVTSYLARILGPREELIKSTPSLAEVFINPATGHVWQENDVIKRIALAETLETIANEGVDTLYNNGTIAKKLIAEIQELGGILTIEDLMDYKVRWQDPEASRIVQNYTMYTNPLPATGLLLTFMLNVLGSFAPTNSLVTSYHRIAEVFKFAYAERTELGDAMFVSGMDQRVEKIKDLEFARSTLSKISDLTTNSDYKYYGAQFSIEEDHGTAHINVFAPNGDAVVVTSTINNVLGSKVRSRTTGIIMNDEMDDFGTPGKPNSYGVPPSPANFIAPGKRPLSSMCPTIIIDNNGDVRMLIGGAGGIKITSSVAYTILRHLYWNESLVDAINAHRIHHQLIPMRLEYDDGLSSTLVNGLKANGHEMYASPSDAGFASLTGISRQGDQIHAVFDRRRITVLYYCIIQLNSI